MALNVRHHHDGGRVRLVEVDSLALAELPNSCLTQKRAQVILYYAEK